MPQRALTPKTNHLTCYHQELNRKWSDVRQLVPQRDNTLAAELRKQQNNETLRRQFAEKANAVGPWIERQMDAVTAIGMGLQVKDNYSSNSNIDSSCNFTHTIPKFIQF